ncbi:hypothetical protein [Lysobacter sp. F6437]|uniref:hypothetical protein n=1 Tax=Lysobacter sp. F6437 TaxID=3459296 RepID=UPI00403DBAD8
MSKRVLLGCIAALATMLVFDLLISLSGWQLDLPLETGFGSIPLGSLVVTFGAMLLGGWIARRRFRWIALGLAGALWLAVVATLLMIAEPPMDSLAMVLKHNALAIVLSLAAAWCGAMLGERLGERPIAAPH